MIQDFDNNLSNNEFKTTAIKNVYNLKNTKKFLAKITIEKISKKETRKLYSNSITADIIWLKMQKVKAEIRDIGF